MSAEAIRSVTHLVLALGGHGLPPQIRTERSGPDVSCPAPSGSVFLGHQSFSLRLPVWQAALPLAWRPSRHRRDQKTFSAGPRSFSTKEFWFPGSISAPQAQPVVDSRHGRITCETAFLPLSKEQRAAPSNQNIGLKVQPLSWLRAALEIIWSSSWDSRGEPPLPIRPLVPSPTLALV
jgi:hypothetical protein